MVEMNEPNILSYSRPIYPDEQADFGDMNLDGIFFNIGLRFKDFQATNDDESPAIPESVGRMVSKIS